MGKRDDKRREKMINEAFKDSIDQMEIQTNMGMIKLISLEEIPLKPMQEIMGPEVEDRAAKMMEAFQLCLVNPEDWENKVIIMPMKEVNRVVRQWMALSSRISELDGPLGEED